MIYDTINNISQYKGLYPNLDIAIDYILSGDLSSLPLGRNEIKDNEIYINVIETATVDAKDTAYEFHKKYLDIHIDIEGEEKIQITNEGTVTKEYNVDEDYALMDGEPGVVCNLDKEHFIICMLDEPHMPCVQFENSEPLKKAIVKIMVNKTGE